MGTQKFNHNHVKLTNDITSLAKSLAKSEVTKQAKPDKDTPESYMFMLHKSWKLQEIIICT